MKLTVNTQELNAGISTVVKALGNKTTVSILEGIYVEATGSELLLRCTDLSLQIETIIGASIEKEGSCVLPGRLFSELVRRLPDEETDISSEKNTVKIESGRAVSSIQAENGKDFMSMPGVKKEFAISLSKNTLKNMIKQCIFATAQDDSKPILTGVLLEMNGENQMSMVALDGYRLAMRNETISTDGDIKNVVIPAKSMLEISRILDDTDEMINVVFSKTHVMIDMGHTKINTRLMDGEFIRYKQILPDSHTTRVFINRQELLESIERVSLMARESKKNHIKFMFEENCVTITANSEIGNSKETISSECVGSNIDIAFNAKYFSDVLKVLDDENIYLEMNSNISPCVVMPPEGNKYYYLILPVRLFTGM